MQKSKWSSWAAWLMALFIGAVLLALTGCVPRDDTDPPDGRSHLTLRKDYGTGCEYLFEPGMFSFLIGGHLTPRLDRDGKQVCK